MRTIFAYLLSWLDTTGTWSALWLNFPMRHVSFVSYPFCAWSSPSNSLINQRAREVGDQPREKEDQVGYHDRIKYADSPRQEVVFPSENGLREVFWIQREWSTEHSPFLSLFSSVLSAIARPFVACMGAHSNAHAKMLSEMFPKKEYKFKYL